MSDSRSGKPSLAVVLSAVLVAAGGILAFVIKPWGPNSTNPDPETTELESAVTEKWGKSLSELEREGLVVVSPHGGRILGQFQQAFVEYCAKEKGKYVSVHIADISNSGTHVISDEIVSRYAAGPSESVGIDILFGGGTHTFENLATLKLLERIDTQAEPDIPEFHQGIRLRHSDNLWCGNALSSFGILVNSTILSERNIESLETWAQLGQKELAGLVSLADPTKSGSTSIALEVVAQGTDNWQMAWSQLVAILLNVDEFSQSSREAADAVVKGTKAATICIDFYGYERVQGSEFIAFVRPKGLSIMTPDAIAILKNPPNPSTAQEFVNFVLSQGGQALWARDTKNVIPLFRTPISMKSYSAEQTRHSAWVSNPYDEVPGSNSTDVEMWESRPIVLAVLVKAAFIENQELLLQIKQKKTLAHILAILASLPPEVESREDIIQLSGKFTDPTAKKTVISGWAEYFQSRLLSQD